MNEADKEWIQPGQLFEVMSYGGVHVISAITRMPKPKRVVPNEGVGFWRVQRIHEQEILMLIRTELSPEKGIIPHISCVIDGIEDEDSDGCIYEFLHGEILVYLHKSHLSELEPVDETC